MSKNINNKRNGFTPVGNIEVRGKFFYITVIKK